MLRVTYQMVIHIRQVAGGLLQGRFLVQLTPITCLVMQSIHMVSIRLALLLLIRGVARDYMRGMMTIGGGVQLVAFEQHREPWPSFVISMKTAIRLNG